MTSRAAYLFIFDGFADWEPALACAQLARNGFAVRAFALSDAPVRSMAGLHVTPDMILADVDLANAAVVIFPGGDAWEHGEKPEITRLLATLEQSHIPVAAICAATIAAAHAGLLNQRAHTSNFAGYINKHVPGYVDAHYSNDVSAVTDRNVITASGMGSVDFAYEILKLLNVYGEADLKTWSSIFRDKVVP